MAKSGSGWTVGGKKGDFLGGGAGSGGVFFCIWRISVIRCTVDIQPHFSVTLDNIYTTFQ